MEEEATPLVSSQAAAAAAIAGAGMINASAEKIHKERAEGPLTWRAMAFIGGLAMIFSNGIAILERFFSFNFTGCLIAIYGVLFGILISFLEGPLICSRKFQQGIRFYAKFLEFTWGRGTLYFFVGSLQVSNWNMLDWAVGGWMMFVGITAILVGISTSRQLRLLKFSVKDVEDLKAKWEEVDEDGNHHLDAKELTQFSKNAGLDMSRNEIAAAFLALDHNFDEKIAFEEFYAWWQAEGAFGVAPSV